MAQPQRRASAPNDWFPKLVKALGNGKGNSVSRKEDDSAFHRKAEKSKLYTVDDEPRMLELLEAYYKSRGPQEDMENPVLTTVNASPPAKMEAYEQSTTRQRPTASPAPAPVAAGTSASTIRDSRPSLDDIKYRVQPKKNIHQSLLLVVGIVASAFFLAHSIGLLDSAPMLA